MTLHACWSWSTEAPIIPGWDTRTLISYSAGRVSATLCTRLSNTFLKLKRFKATEIVHELSNSMLSLFLVLELSSEYRFRFQSNWCFFWKLELFQQVLPGSDLTPFDVLLIDCLALCGSSPCQASRPSLNSPNASRTKAIEIFPYFSSQLAKKKDSNKADAILISSYFYETYKSEE